MNTYYFITEIDTADIKEAKRVFGDKAKFRSTGKLLNGGYWSDELECLCGHKIYKMKTDLSLEECKKILREGEDLHYIYDTINPKETFTGERFVDWVSYNQFKEKFEKSNEEYEKSK